LKCVSSSYRHCSKNVSKLDQFEDSNKQVTWVRTLVPKPDVFGLT
jgi:hypothetical protein